MNVYSLDGAWRLQAVSSVPPGVLQGKTIPAQVPGEVVSDLLAAKRIADPFYRENEKDLQWIGETDWQYQRDFQLTGRLLQEDQVLLQCDGLDTLATIVLNGKPVATTDNMHRQYAWDVKPLLKAGRNRIEITFASVNAYTRQRYPEKPIRLRINQGTENAYPGWVRKEACNFGWDWGPMLVTCGIWRSILLAGVSGGRLSHVQIRQEHTAGQVTLAVGSQVERCTASAPLRVRTVLSYDGQEVAAGETLVRGARLTQKLTVAEPRLWWPRGMGAQPLYDLQVLLLDDAGQVLDTLTRRVGLRTLRLDRQADAWGESFRFVANGVPFFAKGANWIPVDALPGRRPDAVYRRLLEDAAAVNMNMIRVWGGGVYENEIFYALCDELGLCVWQDFMFACMGYPAWDKPFLANAEAEARDNVLRLHHHACLALWCGNNELEQQGVGNGPRHMPWKDYKRLFDGVLPRVVKRYAPDTDYWPCSPHSPHGDRADYNNPACGDAHLWDVWHGKKPFEWYRTCGHRFNSEFGFQSFPEPRTVDTYTTKPDRNITTPVMEHHQRSGIGNTTIMQYMLDWFRLPTSFDMTLWTSQILQGMAIKYACEHWRRSMPRGMGTLYWQLNDVWPVASWASIDYHGRWKALHYMARNFFAPVLLSGLEDKSKGTVELHATSDLLAARPATVRWWVTDCAGRRLTEGSKAIRTPVNGNRKVATLKLAPYLQRQTERDLLVWLELEIDGEPTQSNLVLFARPKHLELAANPGLRVKVAPAADGAFVVTLESKHPALWVWLACAATDLRCSDNFVHLCPGQAVQLVVVPSRKLTLAQFRAGLAVRSLVDTFKEQA